MLDGAVLAGRVDPLQHDEDLLPTLCPEPILEIGQAGQPCGELPGRGVLRVAVRRVRIDRPEVDVRAGPNVQGLAEVGGGSGHRL
jgi:hypothetical protein